MNIWLNIILIFVVAFCFKFWHKYADKLLDNTLTKDEKLLVFLQQCHKLDLNYFVDVILPEIQAKHFYSKISGLYLFVNNDAKKVCIKKTDDVYADLANLCTGNVTSFLDSIVQMDCHDEYDISCYYWSGDLYVDFDTYINYVYQIFMDCGYTKYECPV